MFSTTAGEFLCDKIKLIKTMKKILFIFFVLITQKAIAPDAKIITINQTNPVNIYDRLIRAIIFVESGGDTLAYNPLEDAYGAFQIRPIRLLDYNQRTGKNYSVKDCYRLDISKEIFLYYATRITSNDFETISRNWNGSGPLTLIYWHKVKTLL
jgi:hypothetical protein